MTKSELIAVLAEESGQTKAAAGKVFEAFLNQLHVTEMNITGYFKTEFVDKEARKGRNPQTGEEIVIPAKRTIKFSAGKTLKELVNQ